MIEAVIFDVDGVLTATAILHRRAWADLFAEVLPDGVAPFSAADYDRLVDGRSRRDGLEAVLADRGLLDPTTPGGIDPAELDTIAERKQEHFLAAVTTAADLAYADVAPGLRRLRDHGYPVAAASSSRNARMVLGAAGLADLLDAVVDGTDLARLGLAGKPAPDLFDEAASTLGVAPARCAVVEDAVAGLEAALAGGYGLVIGVDRSPGRRRGLEALADLTIASLSELPQPLPAGRS